MPFLKIIIKPTPTVKPYPFLYSYPVDFTSLSPVKKLIAPIEILASLSPSAT